MAKKMPPKAAPQLNEEAMFISVKGFKSLANETSVEIKPLTILAGPNSSGKSSIMQPLLLLKQTLEAPFDPGALYLRGENVSFTSSTQLLSKTGTKRASSFSVTFGSKGSNISLTFKSQKNKGFTLEKQVIQEHTGEKFEIHPEMSSEEIEKIIINEDLTYQTKETENVFSTKRDRCFLDISVVIQYKNTRGVLFRYKYQPSENAIVPFRAFIQSMIHLPGLRGNAERTYNTTAVGEHYPGVFNNYVASIINDWQENDHAIIKTLGEYMQQIGLGHTIEAKPIDDTQVELLVNRTTSSTNGKGPDMVSIADVGVGVSQTLPVLVALIAAKRDQLVYIEQPEIHLHPRAQVALASVIADAVKRGVRLIIETHSSLLLTGIQIAVAEGSLKPEMVKLHWFSRRQKDGVTEVSSADLDKNGAFGDWPEDFDDIALSTEQRYLDLVESKLKK